MDKYYTPGLEEFYVGFEFETNYLEKDWVKKTLTFDDFGFYNSTYDIDSCKTEFRVKYLDKEDIESLGWKSDTTIKNYFSFEKYIMWFYENNLNIQISVSGDYDFEKNGFKGLIKNKSELVKLLKQLGIE